jgi:hypothetical protein
MYQDLYCISIIFFHHDLELERVKMNLAALLSSVLLIQIAVVSSTAYYRRRQQVNLLHLSWTAACPVLVT